MRLRLFATSRDLRMLLTAMPITYSGQTWVAFILFRGFRDTVNRKHSESLTHMASISTLEALANRTRIQGTI